MTDTFIEPSITPQSKAIPMLNLKDESVAGGLTPLNI